MSPTALLGELRRRGIVVRTEGQDLRLRGPRGILTDDLRRSVLSHKGGILALLRVQEQLLRLGTADPDATTALADLPAETLAVVASLQGRFGGEIVAITRLDAPVVRAEGCSPKVCRACRGTSFWISHADVATCRLCHPPAGSQLVRVWLDDGVETPVDDAGEAP